jgi:hypothetical protein
MTPIGSILHSWSQPIHSVSGAFITRSMVDLAGHGTFAEVASEIEMAWPALRATRR